MHESDIAPRHAADVAFRRVGDDMLLVSARNGRILSLNDVGAFVWEHADGRTHMGEIAEAMATDFAVDEATARRDVREFVAELQERGLLESMGEGVDGP